MLKMLSLFTTWLLLYARTDAAGHLQKQADLPSRSLNDEFADLHESNFIDTRSSYYAPYLNPGFFPPLSSSSLSSDSKDLDYDNSLDIQKRISRLVIDPHSKRWSEMFRVSPKVFRELRNNGQRFRPLFRKDLVDGGYKMSYTPARKRPYYYTEPEGSEFLGGPGK